MIKYPTIEQLLKLHDAVSVNNHFPDVKKMVIYKPLRVCARDFRNSELDAVPLKWHTINLKKKERSR